MNILLLHSNPDLYGSSKIFLQVVQIYQKAGFNPVVVLSGKGPLSEALHAMQVPVRVQNLGILRRKYVTPVGLLNRFSRNRKAYNFFDELHKAYQFKLVYSNTLAVIVGAFWAKRNKLPHIWHIHEILRGPAPLIKLLATMLDRSTKRPIAVSTAVAAYWKPKLKLAKPEVIHNGIPYGEFLKPYPQAKTDLLLPLDKLVITMIGRINPGKGQLFFLEVAKQLRKAYPQLAFVMVGDPYPGYESIAADIREFVKRNALEDSVFNLGYRSDIPCILAATDIFVLPSTLPDSFPTVILEAMAAGKPVVATKSGGAEEMVLDGETGFLFDIEDQETCREKISILVENSDLRAQLGKSGKNRVVVEYNLESFQDKISKHLWKVLQEN